MIIQINNLKCMLARNKAFQKEVESELGSPPNETDMLSRIHKYASLEDHHAYPRITIRADTWSTDAHWGNYLESSTQAMTIELIRDIPADDATALETQYEEICEAVKDICKELSEQSYGEGNYQDHDYLAELLVETGPIWHADAAEEELSDPEAGGYQRRIIWWCNCRVTPQSR